MAVAKRQETGSRVDNLASSFFSSSLLRLVDHSHVSIAPTHTGSVAPSHVPNAFTFSPPLCYPLPSRVPACLSLSSPRCRSRSRQSAPTRATPPSSLLCYMSLTLSQRPFCAVTSVCPHSSPPGCSSLAPKSCCSPRCSQSDSLLNFHLCMAALSQHQRASASAQRVHHITEDRTGWNSKVLLSFG